MRQLRTCDFCDAEAVGAFEIVPPELEPTEAERRRVVACPDCRDRLETLLEPLLARIAGDAAGDGRSEGSGADGSTPDRSAPAEENAPAAGDESDPDPDTPSEPTVLEDGVTFEPEDRTDDAADEDESVVDDGTAAESGAEPDSSERTEAADESTGDEGTAPTTGSPPAYGKVVRLLRNREFPMERSAVENLAAGAYDLENHEAAAIVDHAVENDEFVEKRGILRRP
jgi:hypothetical protein